MKKEIIYSMPADQLIEVDRIKQDERLDFNGAVALLRAREVARHKRKPHSISGPPRNERGELIAPKRPRRIVISE